MYLFVDSETTGLPKRKNASLRDLANWPRLIQLAWIESDETRHATSQRSYIIIPDGFEIPDEVVKIHGISTEKAKKKGVTLRMALEQFRYAINRADVVICHNVSFDEKVVGAEFLRLGMKNALENKQKICTMLASTSFCRLPSRRRGCYKYPSLSELHHALFGQPLIRPYHGLHRASDDVLVTSRCFFALQDLGVIDVTLKKEIERQCDDGEAVHMADQKTEVFLSPLGDRSERRNEQGFLARSVCFLKRLKAYFW